LTFPRPTSFSCIRLGGAPRGVVSLVPGRGGGGGAGGGGKKTSGRQKLGSASSSLTHNTNLSFAFHSSPVVANAFKGVLLHAHARLLPPRGRRAPFSRGVEHRALPDGARGAPDFAIELPKKREEEEGPSLFKRAMLTMANCFLCRGRRRRTPLETEGGGGPGPPWPRRAGGVRAKKGEAWKQKAKKGERYQLGVSEG